MRAKLQEIKEQLRSRLHEAIPEQGRWLKAVVTGFFAYHAMPTNARRITHSGTMSVIFGGATKRLTSHGTG